MRKPPKPFETLTSRIAAPWPRLISGPYLFLGMPCSYFRCRVSNERCKRPASHTALGSIFIAALHHFRKVEFTVASFRFAVRRKILAAGSAEKSRRGRGEPGNWDAAGVYQVGSRGGGYAARTGPRWVVLSAAIFNCRPVFSLSRRFFSASRSWRSSWALASCRFSVTNS